MGVRRCLARFLTSLAFRCALQRVQTVPAAIHSGRIPPSTTTSHRGRKTQPAPSPHRTWSVPDASSQPQLNLYLTHPLANCTAASKSGDDESFLHAMPTSFTIRSSSLSSSHSIQGTGEEFFGREESDSQPALDHIETGGWAAGPADDVRFETGVAAGV